ncbi:hypothetical protein AJ80_06881 [Polytolypa hystricis UAMH7299]|uniref:Succinate dehydrogenase [ubiquinone] cytochrome b small subunit n=1 Tax=Polytolypa hystricis (strain UAMH7299) TaxID=1447883 RepID=A0A2B7XTU4_POLH7|nr:hypothetical protein AJ80_06881 [Polytolypa hystricis UAMH7299]
MASIVRPSASLARQACFAAAPVRNAAFYSTKSSPLTALSTARPMQLKKKDGCSMKVAGFHATSRREILPPLPQVIEGTSNDAAPMPKTNPVHGSYHWTFERFIAASLIPLTIAPFAGGSLNPIMDAVFCGTVLIHSHIGFDAMITDYFPGYRVPKTKKALTWVLRGATLAVGVGLYEFETNDVGVTEAIKRIWTA